MDNNLTLDLMIRVLELEVQYLRFTYASMDEDGGRYNTAASVLEERVKELKELAK